MFTTFRRALSFRRKVYRAGLRITHTADWPITAIHYPSPTPWSDEWYACTDRTVYDSPHYASLCAYTPDPYLEWHRSLRGIDHPRPEKWIRAMQVRLRRLYALILTQGYRCQCVADRIAVLHDGELWDGGHRLACLAHLGRMTVPVVVMERRATCFPWK